MRALLLLLLAGQAVAADPSVTSTRQGPFDYQAQRSDGTTSNHTRPEIAAFACANWLFANPTGTCVVQGGKWVITVTVPSVPPPPPPPPPSGTAALSWTAPTQNTDGTPIAQPVTYNVYYGTAANALTVKATVSTLAYTVTDLPSGTHYFAVSAVAGGEESALSGVGSKVIQ